MIATLLINIFIEGINNVLIHVLLFLNITMMIIMNVLILVKQDQINLLLITILIQILKNVYLHVVVLNHTIILILTFAWLIVMRITVKICTTEIHQYLQLLINIYVTLLVLIFIMENSDFKRRIILAAILNLIRVVIIIMSKVMEYLNVHQQQIVKM